MVWLVKIGHLQMYLNIRPLGSFRAEVVNIKGNMDKGMAWCKQNLFTRLGYIKHAMPDDTYNFLFKYPNRLCFLS